MITRRDQLPPNAVASTRRSTAGLLSVIRGHRWPKKSVPANPWSICPMCQEDTDVPEGPGGCNSGRRCPRPNSRRLTRWLRNRSVDAGSRVCRPLSYGGHGIVRSANLFNTLLRTSKRRQSAHSGPVPGCPRKDWDDRCFCPPTRRTALKNVFTDQTVDRGDDAFCHLKPLRRVCGRLLSRPMDI
jgi:hypothetical protein